jgi:restriction endonuclease Mrr
MNYCASYLKKMGLVETFSMGSYRITEKGRKVLEKYGDKLSLSQLRELPEFIATQINAYNTDAVYIKPHYRGGKYIAPYVCKKQSLNSKNVNIGHSITDSFRGTLIENKQNKEK